MDILIKNLKKKTVNDLYEILFALYPKSQIDNDVFNLNKSELIEYIVDQYFNQGILDRLFSCIPNRYIDSMFDDYLGEENDIVDSANDDGFIELFLVFGLLYKRNNHIYITKIFKQYLADLMHNESFHFDPKLKWIAHCIDYANSFYGCYSYNALFNLANLEQYTFTPSEFNAYLTSMCPILNTIKYDEELGHNHNSPAFNEADIDPDYLKEVKSIHKNLDYAVPLAKDIKNFADDGMLVTPCIGEFYTKLRADLHDDNEAFSLMQFILLFARTELDNDTYLQNSFEILNAHNINVEDEFYIEYLNNIYFEYPSIRNKGASLKDLFNPVHVFIDKFTELLKIDLPTLDIDDAIDVLIELIDKAQQLINDKKETMDTNSINSNHLIS